MQVLTLDLEDDFSLIAVHSTEEDYRLAYLFNKHLQTKFTRYKHNLDFENSVGQFPLFEYKDEPNFLNYYLINNKHIHIINSEQNNGLFGGDYSVATYLIPEKKKVDYFLKIEGNTNQTFILELVEKIKTIKQIITSYSIEPSLLKSKDHLIF